MELSRRNVLAVGGLLILMVGIIAALYISRNPQILKSNAFNTGDRVTITHPERQMKVLGISKIKGEVNTSVDISKLRASIKVGDQIAEGQNVRFKRVGNRIEINGSWDSSRFTPGTYNLQIVVFDDTTNPPTSLGSQTVPVDIVRH
jgi:hypothetical protein